MTDQWLVSGCSVVCHWFVTGCSTNQRLGVRPGRASVRVHVKKVVVCEHCLCDHVPHNLLNIKTAFTDGRLNAD